MERIDELVGRYPALSACRKDIEAAAAAIIGSYERGGKLLVAGNGGSAADADHITGELLKSFVKRRRPDAALLAKIGEVDAESGEYLAGRLQGSLPAISLANQAALMTACLNDVDGNALFAQQVNGFGRDGDVFLGITTSGNSRDVVYAAAVAKAKGLTTIALAGRDGGKIRGISDISIVVPESETFKIQELHLPVYHALCLEVEGHFWKE